MKILGAVRAREPDMKSRSFRQLPRLVADATRLVWKASRRELLVCSVLQVAGAILLGLQVVAGRAALAATIRGGENHVGLAAIAPELLTVAAIFVGLGLVTVARAEKESILGERVGFACADEVLRVSAALDLAAFETPEFHDDLARARAAASRPAVLAKGLMSLVAAVLGVVGISVGIVAIEPLVIPAALAVFAPLGLATRRNGRASYEFARRQTTSDRTRAYLFSTLTSVPHAKEVRAFDLGDHLRDRHGALYQERIDGVRQLVRERLHRSVLAGIASGAFLAAAVTGLCWLLAAGRIDAAGAGASFWGLFLLGNRLQAATSGAGSLHESALYLRDLRDFGEQAPPTTGPAPPETAGPANPAPHLRGPTLGPPTLAASFDRLVVEGVEFTYPDARQPTLRGVCMEIRRGEVVALVGENGSGKTTLAKVLAHLHSPESGRILWDGIDTTEYDPRDVRHRIGVLFQDFIRWDLSAHDNIAFGNPERIHDREAVVTAAKRAQADDFLSRLPAGYETSLSRMFKDGVGLSLGQWQMVSLARAFVRDAAFLIVDEPTASLDAGAEAEVYDRLRELAHERSVLLISHRFASVRSADRIYLLRHGRVAESGSHDELMALGARYARMFNLQAASYLDSPLPG